MQTKQETLRFANIYSDNLVLQQGAPMTIWGFSEGGTVTVSLMDGKEQLCTASDRTKDGRWKVVLPPMEVARGLTLQASCGGETVRCENVAVGEVWVCSGQSNMECDFRYCSGTEAYLEECGRYDVRFMDVEQAIRFERQEEAVSSRWILMNRETVMPVGVAAYIFGHCLAKELDVPVGLIRDYRSGNSIITFLSEERMRARAEYAPFVEQFLAEKKETKSAWSMIPCAIYNAMTAPLEVLRVRGVYWYQGESDAAFDRPGYYPQMLDDLVDQWRCAFCDPKLPVLLVQLPPFGDDPFDYKTVRQTQFSLARRDENIHLVVTADLGPTGEEGESAIHPMYKNPVGERAARAACAEVYQVPDSGEWGGPLFEWAEVSGDKTILHFSHVGEGLCSDGPLRGFEFSRDGAYFAPANAVITGRSTVELDGAAKIIRYCFINITEDRTLGGNLTNETGVPASPFVEIL